MMLAGCARSTIEMSLDLPDPGATAAFDLSCVGAVKVDAIGNDPRARDSVNDVCVDLATDLHSFADLGVALRGKVALDVPGAGLAGVQLRGFSGRCSDPASATYESVFYGGAPSTGVTRIVVPVTPGVGCNTGQSYQVRVLDLLGLYASLPTAICAVPGDPLSVSAGMIRARMLGDSQPRMIFEFGAAKITPIDGTGTLQSFKPVTSGPACISFSYRGASAIGLSCVTTAAQARGLCGASNETEIVALPIAALPALPEPTATYGTLAIGAVWETFGSSKLPLPGATVMLSDPAQGTVVYVDLATQPGVSPPRFKPLTPVTGATATTSGGGFLLYLKGDATSVVVSAPGHATQTVRVASAPDVVATLIVPLPRQ